MKGKKRALNRKCLPPGSVQPLLPSYAPTREVPTRRPHYQPRLGWDIMSQLSLDSREVGGRCRWSGGQRRVGRRDCAVAIWWIRCRTAAFSAWGKAPEPIWNGSLRWFHQWHETLTKGLPMRDSLGLCLRSGTLCHFEAHYPCSC